MQKDVIYIDTEDDITTIIGKVKESDGKVVALVPPKRVGVIQSAVNLKLVHRAAEQAGKHLVIVTNNPALLALAGSAAIPIAKNLQSKPEMPEITVLEADEEDIIDGNSLPAHEQPELAGADGEVADVEDKGPAAAGAVGVTALAAAKEKIDAGKGALAGTAAKARTKVPNFDAFRKKLFVGIAALLLLVGFLVWAFVFAPRATVIIKAKTSTSALNTKVSVGPSLETKLGDGTIKAEAKSVSKDVSVPFTATGKKDVGTKATGVVHFAPTASNLLNVISKGATIPAGTTITSASGSKYTTNDTVVFDSEWSGSKLAQGVDAAVTAVANGASYNGATGQADGPSGFTTTFKTATSGGTDKSITVVQQSDIDAVSADVQKSADTDAAKKSLTDQFGAQYILVDATFKADNSGVKPSPAVGAEATDGKGTLNGKLTYSMMAVPKAEADKFLDAYYAQQIDGKKNQKVYDNGLSTLAFTSPVADGDKYAVTATTNGKVGPNIDANEVKEYAKGKKSGEIKAYVEGVGGVENADVSFSPFWVNSAPNDINKIKVQFNLNG